MEKTCAACGVTFTASRASAKCCSDRCRKRYQRGGGQLVELRQVAQAESGELGRVELAATRDLEEAGRLSTPLGQAALVLARRLDGFSVDTGSSVAAVVRQLHATMSSALAGAHVADDPVDELRRRRDRKLGLIGR